MNGGVDAMTNARTRGMMRIAALGFSISSLATFVDCPRQSSTTPTLQCTDFSMFVVPGTCELFGNPCGSSREWLNPAASLPDAFQLSGRPDSVYLRRNVTNGMTTRSVCVAKEAGTINGDSIDFTYGYDTFDRGPLFGTGRMTLTAASPLQASVSATPARIGLGESSQLVASVSGGIPPYTYSWTPTAGLSADYIPTPLATPSVTTTYELMVGDASGLYLGARPGPISSYTGVPSTVTVSVEFELQVSADPQVINPGDVSQLTAYGGGGTPPFTFIWSPADSLGDPTVANPLAQPPTTTAYTVIATDADGVSLTGSLELRVLLLVVSLTATPGMIDAGHSTQLDATAIGGDGRYSYSWSPPAGLSDPTSRTPVASPAATTTYTVMVTDGQGFTATGQVPVIVNAAAPVPTASFIFTRVLCTSTTPCSNGATIGQEVFLDGSNSAGNIVSYTWEFDWTTTSPDAVSSGPTSSIVLPEGNQRGNIVLTVTAADGQTASASRRFP
jgi:hypothetical protein